MNTVLITHPDCLLHDPGMMHPESAERLKAINRVLEHKDFCYLAREVAPKATREQLLRVHTQEHVDYIFDVVPSHGEEYSIDGDTIISSMSGEAALRAAGAVCAAVDDIAAGRCQNGFCAVRPPGHHAEQDVAMGFCLFNNIAVGALHAQAVHGFKRVAVIDFDVHHGNGTQAIFWNKPDCFYASSHQTDAFPFSGFPEESGGENGGVIVNVQLSAGSGSDSFRIAYSNVILPKLRKFAPDFLFISAGYDAHVADPLAYLRVRSEDFDWLTHELLAVAREYCKGRVVSVLEGGYDTRALAACVASHIRIMMQG